MSDILVDSNVILDILTRDPRWYEWSATTLGRLVEGYRLAINPLIYAEVSVGFNRLEELDAVIPEDVFSRAALPWEAAFLAGQCFLKYRRGGGARRSPLPDFYIGAHAAVLGMPLLTRDARRYQRYFPRLQIIAPQPGA